MRHFIFLEFLDHRVESILRELRDALRPKITAHSPVHITVRGPYKKKPDLNHMRELSEHLKGRGVRIMGAGIFSTPNGYAVFLRAESSAFREIWWKPDFQSSLDEIQPHLTLYETKSYDAATLAYNFLRASRIVIQTYAVQLSIYSSGQRDLFGTKPVAETPPNHQLRRDIVAIDAEVLPAAHDLGVRLAEIEAQKPQRRSELASSKNKNPNN